MMRPSLLLLSAPLALGTPMVKPGPPSSPAQSLQEHLTSILGDDVRLRDWKSHMETPKEAQAETEQSKTQASPADTAAALLLAATDRLPAVRIKLPLSSTQTQTDSPGKPVFAKPYIDPEVELRVASEVPVGYQPKHMQAQAPCPRTQKGWPLLADAHNEAIIVGLVVVFFGVVMLMELGYAVSRRWQRRKEGAIRLEDAVTEDARDEKHVAP